MPVLVCGCVCQLHVCTCLLCGYLLLCECQLCGSVCCCWEPRPPLYQGLRNKLAESFTGRPWGSALGGPPHTLLSVRQGIPSFQCSSGRAVCCAGPRGTRPALACSFFFSGIIAQVESAGTYNQMGWGWFSVKQPSVWGLSGRALALHLTKLCQCHMWAPNPSKSDIEHCWVAPRAHGLGLWGAGSGSSHCLHLLGSAQLTCLPPCRHDAGPRAEEEVL